MNLANWRRWPTVCIGPPPANRTSGRFCERERLFSVGDYAGTPRHSGTFQDSRSFLSPSGTNRGRRKYPFHAAFCKNCVTIVVRANPHQELRATPEHALAAEPMPAPALKVLIVDDNVVEPSKQRVPRVGKGSVFSIRACLGHE
jgi:hypothetical protein